MPSGDVAVTRLRTRRLQQKSGYKEKDAPATNRDVILRRFLQEQVRKNVQKEQEETQRLKQLEEDESAKKEDQMDSTEEMKQNNEEEVTVEEALLLDTVDPEETLRLLDKKLDELADQKHKMFLLLKHILSEEEKKRQQREAEIRRQIEEQQQQRMVQDVDNRKEVENQVNQAEENEGSPLDLLSSPPFDRVNRGHFTEEKETTNNAQMDADVDNALNTSVQGDWNNNDPGMTRDQEVKTCKTTDRRRIEWSPMASLLRLKIPSLLRLHLM